MSAAQLLPWLQACARQPAPVALVARRVTLDAAAALPLSPSHSRPAAELAFYRKYTEGMLRRYVSMSMEAGRVPSLLGKEIFPGNMSTYQVHSFEDSVIFIHDIESCINKLDTDQQWLIRRIALQQFTQDEAARMLKHTRRSIMRKYNDAMNRLTGILLEVKLLEPFSCG